MSSILKNNSKEPLVCSITLNWNTKNDTVECLNSLNNLDYKNLKSFVVDNGSNDGSIDFIKKEKFDNLTIIKNSENLGYSRGFNRGINEAIKCKPDYLLIHNNDIIFDSQALNALVKQAELDTNIGFTTGKVYYYDDPKILQTVGRESDKFLIAGDFIGDGEEDLGQYDEVKQYPFCDDVFLLVRKEVIDEVGGYDNDFFFMYEITDWCYRVTNKGYKIYYTPSAKIWHKISRSTGGRKTPINKYYINLSQFMFMKKHASIKSFNFFSAKFFIIDFIYEILAYTIQVRFDLVKAIISSRISGLIWLLKNPN